MIKAVVDKVDMTKRNLVSGEGVKIGLIGPKGGSAKGVNLLQNKEKNRETLFMEEGGPQG